jgi:glycosyltransferase involved in cell wall biosynthesis
MGRKLLILNERDRCHPWAGGAELNLSETAKRLAQRGYDPLLLCSRFPGAAAEDLQEGLRVRRFGNRLTYYLMLPAIVRRELVPGTVIVEHLNKVPFCTPLYTRAPVVAVTHHLFGRTAFWQVPFPVAATVYAAEQLIPFVYRARRFIAVSPSTREDLIRRGIPAAAISVIPNGVDHGRYHAGGHVPDPRPTLLVLGRLEPYKRIELVLQALRRVLPALPTVQLLVVGDGAARASLQAEVQQLGLAAHVSFTGFVSEDEKVDHIRRAHVIVNTSEKEGWGLTVLEANACGVPAVASDVAGLRDAVRHGETGILVPHGDVALLADALRQVLEDPGYRARLSAGAMRWAQRFSWEAGAADTAAIVEAVAAAWDVAGAGDAALPRSSPAAQAGRHPEA